MQLLIYVFLVKLVLGVNGKLLVIVGASIWHWLFGVICKDIVRCLSK